MWKIIQKFVKKTLSTKPTKKDSYWFDFPHFPHLWNVDNYVERVFPLSELWITQINKIATNKGKDFKVDKQVCSQKQSFSFDFYST